MQSKSRIPDTLLNGDNTSLDNPTDIGNVFASFFYSVFIDSSLSNITYDDGNNISLDDLDTNGVLNSLKCTKNKSTAGPDKIPAFILKDCAHVLADPLTKLFNLSLTTHIFPDTWKQGKISPVFRAGSTSSIENYHPISILSNIAKVFERCIYNKLTFK